MELPMNIASLQQNQTSLSPSPSVKRSDTSVIAGDAPLTINEVVRVARYGAQVYLTSNAEVLQRVQASRDYIADAVSCGQPIYGVTSGFGGMANIAISHEYTALLQNNLIWYHKTGTGQQLPLADVRAACFYELSHICRVHRVFGSN